MFTKITSNEHSRRLFRDLAEGRKHWETHSGGTIRWTGTDKKIISIDDAKAESEFEGKIKNSNSELGRVPSPKKNLTHHFDCTLQFETEMPNGDKTDGKHDALSMMIIEYHKPTDRVTYQSRQPKVEVHTVGNGGAQKKTVNKAAQYSDRFWSGNNNPNFLLSGQLSGFDSIDYRTRVDAEHLVKPKDLYSTFDKPAMLNVKLKNWAADAHIYMVITSYKYLTNGELCQESKEFDCISHSFLTSSTDRMCMNVKLACDGLPNCGQELLPNQVLFICMISQVF